MSIKYTKITSYSFQKFYKMIPDGEERGRTLDGERPIAAIPVEATAVRFCMVDGPRMVRLTGI